MAKAKHNKRWTPHLSPVTKEIIKVEHLLGTGDKDQIYVSSYITMPQEQYKKYELGRSEGPRMQS